MSEYINKCVDPRAIKRCKAWNCTVTGPVDGHYTYTQDSQTLSNGTVTVGGAEGTTNGLVLFAHVTCAHIDKLAYEWGVQTWRGTDWVAARIHDNATSTTSLCLNRGSGPVTLLHAGMYTPDDWEHLYALWQAGRISIPWCAGPRNAAAGVLGPWQL